MSHDSPIASRIVSALLSVSVYLVISLASIASGATELSKSEQDFTTEGERLLQEIIKRGTPKIGDLDLRDLVSKSKSISWRVRPIGKMNGSASNRQTAENFVENSSVEFSREDLRIIPWRTRPLLSLHETWGALGTEDEAYERTLGLFIYVYLKNELNDPSKFPQGFREAIEALFDGIELRTQNQDYQVARGGTSVGSGGDGTAIDFKMALLLFGHPLTIKFPEFFQKNSLTLLKKVLVTRIECSTDTSHTSAVFARESHRYVVHVPCERWRSGYAHFGSNSLSLDQWQLLAQTLRSFEVYE